ncbi:TIGR00730 family Rossman fold protein [bacterium]|nr:TIGR00730 family Rossman fold protein [bacterium]
MGLIRVPPGLKIPAVISEMNRIKERIAVCVFCASSNHVDSVFIEAARSMGTALVSKGMMLVYGGGNNGLMGILSEEMHKKGGRIVGVITANLKGLGYAFEGADEMIVTDSMRERKAVMEDLADGFVCLPGGLGTLEEFLEIITFKQLGLHAKPVVLLNVRGFFDNLLRQMETGYEERFIENMYHDLFHVTDSADDALDYIVCHTSG